MKLIRKSFGAGFCISLASAVYLNVESKVLGAFLFSIGLFAICAFGMNLFTGMIGYALEDQKKLKYPVVWLGNFAGCLLTCLLIRIACPVIRENATALVANKLSLNYLVVFIRGLFCGSLMYIAVDNYKKHPHEVSGIFGLVMGVAVFILAGFEHCVADMCYCTLGVVSLKQALLSLVFLIVVTAGNMIGAWCFRFLSK